jgi:hypothetical protein
MAGLVPAIQVPGAPGKNVDARDKPGHDELMADRLSYARRYRTIAASPASSRLKSKCLK